MEFFLDTADVKLIEKFTKTGLIDGVTTNPTLIAQTKRPWKTVVQEITDICDGVVSVEVTALEYEPMKEEALYIAEISSNIAVKVPLTPAGLRVCKELSDEDKLINVTLCFSPLQAVMAAKAGATFVSLFLGRIDDIGYEGLDLMQQIQDIYAQHNTFTTLTLAASIRHPLHVLQAAKTGIDAVTMPPHVFEALTKHPLTDSGIKQFEQDWQTLGQKILT